MPHVACFIKIPAAACATPAGLPGLIAFVLQWATAFWPHAAPHRAVRASALRMPRAGFALIKMAGGLGSFVGPSLIGALSDAGGGGSYAAAVLLLAAFLLAASAMQLWFREPGAPRGRLGILDLMFTELQNVNACW